MRYLFVLLFFSACFAVSRASAEDDPQMQTSGNAFLYLCEAPLDAKPLNVKSAECLLFTIGMGEGIAMFADRGGSNVMFCSPDGVTAGQRARILVKFIKEHPQSAHEETRLLMLASLIDAFPCKAESAGKK